MLGRLFSSVIRVEILALLFNNPTERFYLREIARLVGKNAAGVKRELDNLYRMGIVNVEPLGNLRYYRVNPDCYLYPELRGLIVKALGVEGTLKSILRAAESVSAAFLYGPCVQDQKANIVDLLLVGQTTPTLETRFREAEAKLGKTIRATFLDEKVYREWTRKGDARLSNMIAGKRITLKGRP